MKKLKTKLIAMIIMAMAAMFLVAGSAQAKTVKLEVGKTKKLTQPKAKGDAKWTTSDKNVAKVSQKGVVTAAGEGKCTVKVKKGNKKKSWKITVTNSKAKKIRKKIYEMKKKYPHGSAFSNEKPYTEDKSYQIKAPVYDPKTGLSFFEAYGCAAFAFECQDHAFGTAEAKAYYSPSKIKVGDVLRIFNNTHSIIVLQKKSGKIIAAEGNSGGKVAWNSVYSMKTIKNNFDYGITRY